MVTGVAAGVALACKVEIGGALAVAAGVVLLLQPWRGRGRAWWADMAALIAPAVGILVAAYAWALQYASWRQVVVDSYLLLYNLPEPLRYYNRWRSGFDHPWVSLLDMALAVGVCAVVGCGLLLGTGARRRKGLIAGLGAGLALLAVGALLHQHPWQSPLRASPLLAALLPLWLWRRRRRRGAMAAPDWILILFCVAALVSMGRVLLKVPSGGVAGSFVIPLPLLLWVWVMAELLPQAAGRPVLCRRLIEGVLAVAALGTVVTIGVRYRRMPLVPLRTARGTVQMGRAQEQAVTAALRFIDTHTLPNDPVLAVPAGSALNFFSGRLDPLRYDILIPGYLTPGDERAAMARLQSTHTRYIFVMNRPTDENGARAFGHDYYQVLGGWIFSHYHLVRVLGDYPLGADPEIGPGPFFIKIYAADGLGARH